MEDHPFPRHDAAIRSATWIFMYRPGRIASQPVLPNPSRPASPYRPAYSSRLTCPSCPAWPSRPASPSCPARPSRPASPSCPAWPSRPACPSCPAPMPLYSLFLMFRLKEKFSCPLFPLGGASGGDVGNSAFILWIYLSAGQERAPSGHRYLSFEPPDKADASRHFL